LGDDPVTEIHSDSLECPSDSTEFPAKAQQQKADRRGRLRAQTSGAMKRVVSFLLLPILSLALTVSPVMAQTTPAPKEETTMVEVHPPTPRPAASTEMGQKVPDRPVLAAFPPSDNSTPPGRTSRAAMFAVIVGGAAVVAAIILAMRGGNTPATVLTPGTATVGAPAH